MLSDENFQRYTRALYPVGAVLIMIPLVDIMVRAYPANFGALQWRFGMVGLLFGNMGTLLLGTALVGLAAAFNAHRGTLRALGYVAFAGTAVMLALIALFALDAVQMRTLAPANMKRAFLGSSIEALFAGVVGAITLFSIGRGALGASRTVGGLGRRTRPAASPLVVAGPSTDV